MAKKQDTPAKVPSENPEVVTLKRQLEETTNLWKRALADYQNLQKRVQEEKSEFVKFSAKILIEKLLSVLDDLEKAQAHLKDQGLGLTLKKLEDVLKLEGVKKIDAVGAVGKDYDIQSMEAIVMEEGKEAGKVLAELRPGYTMHGAVLRPAQVKVSQKKK
jgi:molecular chaperone GrpE